MCKSGFIDLYLTGSVLVPVVFNGELIDRHIHFPVKIIKYDLDYINDNHSI